MARDLIETNISNMSDGEFKVTIIRIFAGLDKNMEDIREGDPYYRDKRLKKTEMKTATTEIKKQIGVMTTSMEEDEK